MNRIALISSSKALLFTLVGVVLLAVAGTTIGYASMSEKMTLSLDGESTTIRTLGGTVEEVLEGEGIEIDEAHDIVAPGLDETVDEGSRITVRFGRPLELEVDGEQETHWVHSTEVGDALTEIGDRYLGAELSVSRGATIDRTGMSLTISTPKKLSIKIGAQDREIKKIAGSTVKDVLENLDVKYDEDDIVRPALDTEVEKGTKITLTRVKVVTKSVEDEAYELATIEQADASMYEGDTTVVRSGEAGVRDVTYRLEYRNGKLYATKIVSQDVHEKAIAEIVKVGTKEQPTANYASGGTVWDALANCESGGNWAINTGNGYYGGLQFSLSTWRAYGGSGYPHQNSRAEQIRIAEKLRSATGGYGSWPHCSSKLGLPR